MVKKILIGIIAIVVIVVVAAGIWLYMNDYFYGVKVSEEKLGPLTFVYTTHKGDYSKVGPDMMAFYDKIKAKFGVNPTKGMAIYYDNPNTTKSEDLRSDIGYLLEGSDAKKMETIMISTKVRWIGPKDYVVVYFPLKGNASYMIGAMKAYPALSKYIELKGYKSAPSIEIYDTAKKQIVYGFQITR